MEGDGGGRVGDRDLALPVVPLEQAPPCRGHPWRVPGLPVCARSRGHARRRDRSGARYVRDMMRRVQGASLDAEYGPEFLSPSQRDDHWLSSRSCNHHPIMTRVRDATMPSVFVSRRFATDHSFFVRRMAPSRRRSRRFRRRSRPSLSLRRTAAAIGSRRSGRRRRRRHPRGKQCSHVVARRAPTPVSRRSRRPSTRCARTSCGRTSRRYDSHSGNAGTICSERHAQDVNIFGF